MYMAWSESAPASTGLLFEVRKSLRSDFFSNKYVSLKKKKIKNCKKCGDLPLLMSLCHSGAKSLVFRND